MILGLDLGASHGWAVVDRFGAYVRSGHRKFTTVHDLGAQVHQLSMSISDLCDEFGIEAVWVEAPTSRNYLAQRRLFAYPAVAAWVAHVKELAYDEIFHNQACKLLIGKGNATKTDGVIYARQFKPLLNSDDEADAILVALAAHKLRERQEAA